MRCTVCAEMLSTAPSVLRVRANSAQVRSDRERAAEVPRALPHSVRSQSASSVAACPRPSQKRASRAKYLDPDLRGAVLSLDDLLEILGRVLVVERSGERRVREHQRVALLL